MICMEEKKFSLFIFRRLISFRSLIYFNSDCEEKGKKKKRLPSLNYNKVLLYLFLL